MFEKGEKIESFRCRLGDVDGGRGGGGECAGNRVNNMDQSYDTGRGPCWLVGLACVGCTWFMVVVVGGGWWWWGGELYVFTHPPR